MTMYTVKTTSEEANLILKGDKAFVFRKDAPQFAVGNNISFAVADSRRLVPHPIEGKTFKITVVERGEPIEDGVLAIGFRPIT